MKRFTQSVLLLISAGLLFTACQSDESNDVLSTAQPKVIGNPYVIGESNAISSGISFLKGLPDEENISLRSVEIENLNAEVMECDFMIAVADESDAKVESVTQEVPVYTISYKDDAGKDAGVVMMIGDERVPDKDKILMYGIGGELIADWTTRENADFFKDRIAGYIHNKINNPEDEDAPQLRYVHDLSHTYYLVSMQCDWPQNRDPYNRYAKGVPGKDYRFWAGCVAIAMAEIMTHHNWPLSGTFPRYTDKYTPAPVTVSYALSTDEYQRLTGTPDISGAPVNSIPSYENIKEHIANRIAECGYRVNMMYGMRYAPQNNIMDLGSFASDSKIPAAFKAMGYSCSELVRYDINTIKTDLQNQRPVYMAANNPETGGRHAFVIKGVAVTPQGDHYVFLALDDPWYKDGIVFNSQIFTDPKYVLKKGEIRYTYHTSCDIIHNIRPNK